MEASMPNGKELILFIPGIGAKEPEEHLEKLITGVSDFCRGKGLTIHHLKDNAEVVTGQRHIDITLANGQQKTFDIQEIYWGDLRPFLSSAPAVQKVVRGFDLLWFWTISLKTWWQAILYNRYMMFSMICTLLLFLIWYYGAVAAGCSAIGSNPEFLKISLPENIASWFANLGEAMGSWYVWVVTSMVTSILPVTEVIDISYAVKHYLQNRNGMYHKVCGRLIRALALATQSPEKYDRITVLGHSFGGVISINVLDKYTARNSCKVRLMTLGSPLLFIAARWRPIQEAISDVINNNNVDPWIDFYSNQDWLCTRSPVEEASNKFESHKISTTVSFDAKLTGASHFLYFDDWDVIDALLN
jgi:hypothetical protein